MPSNSREYMDAYYKKHRKRILERMNERVPCEICNIKITRCNMTKHQKSSKHKRNLDKDEIVHTNIDAIKKDLEDLKKLIQSSNYTNKVSTTKQLQMRLLDALKDTSKNTKKKEPEPETEYTDEYDYSSSESE